MASSATCSAAAVTASVSAAATSLFSLSGKTALITGGGTGIGAAIAKGLAEAGARVVLVGRRELPLQQTANEINASLPNANTNTNTSGNLSAQVKAQVAFALPADILNYDEHTNLIHKAGQLTGQPVTILVNNAGVNVRQPAPDLTPDHWHTSLDLMLTAPFYLAKACSPNFRSQNYGRIVNVASLQSYRAFPDSIPYATAKSGVLGLCRSMAEYFSPVHGYHNVTCNNIGPGYVKTDLTAKVFEDEERAGRLASATILGRNSVPEDLVGTAVYFCSNASSYVTGQTIMVDGGFTSLGLR